jgi:hypothetical protein
LVVRKAGMFRVVEWWLRHIPEDFSHRYPVRLWRGWFWDREAAWLITSDSDEDESLTGLRDPVVCRDVEVPDEVVVVERMEAIHEVSTTHLGEHGYVFHHEGPGPDLLNEAKVLEDQCVSLVAQMSATLLLGEALARRTASEEVEIVDLRSFEKLCTRDFPRVRLEPMSSEVLLVGIDTALVVVERRAEGEPGLGEPEAQASGAAKGVDRDWHAPLHAREV